MQNPSINMREYNMRTIVARHHHGWLAGVSTLALAVGLISGPAAAQAQPAAAAPASNANTVGEVVVTAQFREQSLQQTPLAITAVNAKMLDQRSEHSIYQVAAQAPNVTLKPAGAAFGSALGSQ